MIEKIKLRLALKRIKNNLKKLVNKTYSSRNSNIALDRMLLDIVEAYEGFVYGRKSEYDDELKIYMQKSCISDYGDKNNYFTYQVKRYDNKKFGDKNFYVYYTIDKKVDKNGIKRFSIKDFEFIFR